MNSNLVQLKEIILEDEKNEQILKNKYANIFIYDGEIYSDKFLIDTFPIKYKKEERLSTIKKLLFFLAMTSTITDIKKNLGVFFTLDTFKRSGYGDISGAQMHNVLKGLKNCGIVWIINNHYQFGHHDGTDFCKLYGVNAAGIINSWPEEYDEYVNDYTYNAPKKTANLKFKKEGVIIEANAFMEKKKRTPWGKKVETVKETKETSYNRIKRFTRNSAVDFYKKLDEYNKDKPKELQKSMKFNILPKKITARAYSDYIRTRNITSVDALSRESWKKKNNVVYEYDIKACVPMVSHLLKTGEWMPKDYDFYQDCLNKSKVDSSIITRDVVKRLHMRMRFGKSIKASYNNYIWGNHSSLYKKNSYDYATHIRNCYFNEVWEPLYKQVVDFEGTNHSADVFYWESYLELIVVYKLMKLGITAYNVYDCFYLTKKVNDKFMASIIEEAAKYVYKKYCHREVI